MLILKIESHSIKSSYEKNDFENGNACHGYKPGSCLWIFPSAQKRLPFQQLKHGSGAGAGR